MSSSSINRGFLVFQRPLGGGWVGIFFCSLPFPLICVLPGAALVSLACVCGFGLGRGGASHVVLADSPFWDEDRKWAQQRKHDLLSLPPPSFYPLTLFPL